VAENWLRRCRITAGVFRAIELGDAQLAEILGDAVEPARPVFLIELLIDL
jgi:hypothetical protein